MEQGGRNTNSRMSGIALWITVMVLGGCSLPMSREVPPTGMAPVPSAASGSAPGQLAPASSGDVQMPIVVPRAENVVSVTARSDISQASRTVTDRESIKALLKTIEQATFVGFDNAGRQLDGYLIIMTLGDDKDFAFHYWVGEERPNVRDIRGAKWWYAPGLDSAIRAFLP